MLAFPGLFKGVLEARITQIEEKHLIAAAEALANYIQNPSSEQIIPSALDTQVADIVAQAVKQA